MSSFPGIFFSVSDSGEVPWLAIARHCTAFIFYALALVQWPGHVVSDWAGEDRPFAYSITSLMFTLAFWCACLFHYLVSAGRVEIEWSRGRVRAKGWIVKSSRRAHRVLLSLALAISAMTIIQSTTTAMIINHFYIKEDEPHPKEHAILILLKIDQTLAFFLLVYVLGRLVFEPVSIRKGRRPTVVSTNSAELGKEAELPGESEECSICVERWANRQLGCGHLICCCCLGEIWKAEKLPTIRCPFCRKDVSSVRKLTIVDGGQAQVNECCGEMLTLASTTTSSATTRGGSLEDVTLYGPLPTIMEAEDAHL